MVNKDYQKIKGKLFPYSFQSVVPELISVYRQSARRWLIIIIIIIIIQHLYSAIVSYAGCRGAWSHPPSGRLPLLYARPAVTFPAHWLVPNYTTWWQRHMHVSSLGAVIWNWTVRDSNPRLFGSLANALPLCHTQTCFLEKKTDCMNEVTLYWAWGPIYKTS